MQKIQASDLKIKKIMNGSNKSIIYLLKDESILKLYNTKLLSILKKLGIDHEKKILDTKELTNVPEIMTPKKAVYDGNIFIGYTMSKALGQDYNTYDDNLSLKDRENLLHYIKRHLLLEDIVKRSNKENIVFPDLCTCDNIFINGDRISLIDYDGLQVKEHRVDTISTSLGEPSQYYKNRKYMTEDNLFTSELDKKSLIILFFLTTFNINLNKVGTKTMGQTITLDDVFYFIGLEDYDIMNKVWKIFNNEVSNEFLGDDLYRLYDNYQLKVLNQVANNQYIKKLIKK